MAELKSALQQVSAQPADKEPSIAVLPFANMSADKENEYFSDGLAEEILNLLAKIPGLKVIARTSSFAFRGKEQDITKIAEALRVQNILEGSVRRSGNRIRVTAQLIHAADGTHIWSERYDREMTDVFAVQDEISLAIAQELKLKLSPQPAAKPRYTPKLPAYEAYLKARHFHWMVTAESMARANEFYEQAIALDPQFALAHALYADYLFGRTVLGMTPMREAAPVIRAVAQKALELDRSLPEAHAVLCILAAAYDYDWREGARRFILATASQALSPWALAYLGEFYLVTSGRKKEAVEQVERAVQGDPLHLTIRTIMAACLGAAGRYAEAEAQLRQILDLDPNVGLAYSGLAFDYAARRMFVEALPLAEKAFSLAPWYASNVGIYAGLLVRAGQQNRGIELIQRLGSGEVYGTPMGLAIFHTCCDEIDLAADWIEKVIEERFPSVAYWLQTRMAAPLRASPRWPKLAALMNLHEKAL
jgi:TolB-like protein